MSWTRATGGARSPRCDGSSCAKEPLKREPTHRFCSLIREPFPFVRKPFPSPRGNTGHIALVAALGACLSACTSVKPSIVLTVPVAASLREPCTRPPIDVTTVGGMGGTIVRQEAALTACQLKRDALLSAIDAQAAAAKQLAGK